MRDFLLIMQEHRYFKDSRWNKTDSTYTFETGSKIEFFSIDQPDKVRGARRDRLFINEANNIPFEAFEQLEVRTKELVFLDWNPSAEFWYYTEIKGKRTDVEELTLTYKDNEALNINIIKSIEQRKDNKNWWLVYGLGQLGELEGRVYKGWQIIGKIPHEARLERRGLDFGYSIDPTVIVDIYRYNGGFIIDEVVYQKGLSNRTIHEMLSNMDHPEVPIIADSAEPKSIDEIKSYGTNILPAIKGQGSVYQGIQFVQDQKISLTSRSLKTIKAYRNYMFTKDRTTNKYINTPDDTVHEWSNSMDAIRYGLDSYRNLEDKDNDEDYSIYNNDLE